MYPFSSGVHDGDGDDGKVGVVGNNPSPVVQDSNQPLAVLDSTVARVEAYNADVLVEQKRVEVDSSPLVMDENVVDDDDGGEDGVTYLGPLSFGEFCTE